MIGSPFCSVFFSALSVLLSGTTYVEFNTNLVKYWEAPCYLTPNHQSTSSLFFNKKYGDPFSAIENSLPGDPNPVQPSAKTCPLLINFWKAEGYCAIDDKAIPNALSATHTILALIPFPGSRRSVPFTGIVWPGVTATPTNILTPTHTTLLTNVRSHDHAIWVTTKPIPTYRHLTCASKVWPWSTAPTNIRTAHTTWVTTTPTHIRMPCATTWTPWVTTTPANDRHLTKVMPGFKPYHAITSVESTPLATAGRVRSSTDTIMSIPDGSRSTALTVVTGGQTSRCVGSTAPSKLSDLEEFLTTYTARDATSTKKYEVVVTSGVRSEFPAQCETSATPGPSKCVVDGTCSTDVGFVKEYTEQCMEQCVHLSIRYPHFEESIVTLSDMVFGGLVLFLAVNLYCTTKLHKLLKKERAARLALEATVCQLREDSKENLELAKMLQKCNQELHTESTVTNKHLQMEKAALDLKCSHLQKEAEMNATNAKQLLEVLEHVKSDNNEKDKILRNLKYENEDQKKTITFYTDLIEYEVNVSKTLRKENYEMSQKLQALEKENQQVKQELSLMKATPTVDKRHGDIHSLQRKVLEVMEKVKKPEECLILPYEEDFYEEDPEIYKYCDAATCEMVQKFKQSFSALAGYDKAVHLQQHTPPLQQHTPSSPESEQPLSVNPEPQAQHYFELYDLDANRTYSETENYEIPAAVSMLGLTSASIFDSPHLAHMFGREPIARPSQIKAHRERMPVLSPLVHSITSSNSGSSEHGDANQWA